MELNDIPSAYSLEKTRYILIYYISSEILSEIEIKRKFNANTSRIYGLNGNILLGTYFSIIHQKFPVILVRISHNQIDRFFSSLFFLREIVAIPIKTFGSINKAKDYINTKNWEDFSKNLGI